MQFNKQFDGFSINIEPKDTYFYIYLHDDNGFHTSDVVGYNFFERLGLPLRHALKRSLKKLQKKRKDFYKNEDKLNQICRDALASQIDNLLQIQMT